MAARVLGTGIFGDGSRHRQRGLDLFRHRPWAWQVPGAVAGGILVGSGAVGDDLHELMAVHARACALAPPDPKRLAGWLATLRLDGPGWPDFELHDYQTVLGDTGRVELERIVDERAATAEPDVCGRTPFEIRILREQLAEISGDLEHYVAVLAEHLDSARQYLQIVCALRSAGRVAEAEQWAQRGLRLGNAVDQDKLTDAYEDLLLERGGTDEALALRWDLFEQNPTAAHYTAVRRTASRIGKWKVLRNDALARDEADIPAPRRGFIVEAGARDVWHAPRQRDEGRGATCVRGC